MILDGGMIAEGMAFANAVGLMGELLTQMAVMRRYPPTQKEA
jgi:hypothetical protein